MKILRNTGLSSDALRAVFLVMVFLCAPLLFTIPAHAADNAKDASNVPSDYIIGSEDVLDISVWKNDDLSRVVSVRPDGKISLPLIGDVQAAGLTPNQLRDKIIDKLKLYQETAVAAVIVQTVNSYRVFMVGEVNAPGVYQLKSRTTILQAIALAGGFTQFASKNSIVLIRKSPDGMSEEKIHIRFKDLVYSADDKNLVLKAGDTIFVP